MFIALGIPGKILVGGWEQSLQAVKAGVCIRYKHGIILV